MTNFDYKKYSLEHLENWIHDAISCSEASPQEIYDVIKGVVSENYHIYKNHTARCYELLALLNGDGEGHIPSYDEYKGSTVSSVKKDKVKRWVLPVEETKIAETDETEYFISFPNDLLEAANLQEGDQVEWVDQNNGSYLLKKVLKTYDSMINSGYTMTADGFWIKE
jgi:hypothetical protein